MTEKAVEIMHKKASELPEYSETTRPDTYFKSGFRSGYHQAEKDLELTWEDVIRIYLLVISVSDMQGWKGTDKSIYQEVLKRFKGFKERKEK